MHIPYLEKLINPIDRTAFLSEYFGKKPLFIKGDPAKFSGVMTWPELNSILEYHRLDQRLRLFRNSAPVSPDCYIRNSRISGPELASQLRNGATLFIKDVDEVHGPLSRITSELETDLECRVAANLYAVWHAARGLDIHWDDHDVMILQVFGTKHWQIYGQAPVRFPLKSGRAQDGLKGNSVIFDEYLTPGDFLYLPRGWWHQATPCESAALHITIGIYSPTGIDLLQWLVSHLKKYEYMRMDVPRLAPTAERIEYLEQIHNVLKQALSDPRILDQFVHETSVNLRSLTSVALPWAATHGLLPEEGHTIVPLAWPALRMQHFPELKQIEVSCGGCAYKFGEELQPLFASLDCAEGLSIHDFYEKWSAGFAREQLAAFLKDLVGAGIIGFRQPTHNELYAQA